EHVADVVLNQNLGAARAALRVASTTRTLCGTRYTGLRREFWPWRGRGHETRAPARSILVALGGSDPRRVTGRVVAGLSRLGDIAVTLVLGTPIAIAELQRVTPGDRFALVVAPPDLVERMSAADLAIAGAGATTWELAFLGVPSLLVVAADNQRPGA